MTGTRHGGPIGRHRLGDPRLRHCREFNGVRERLVSWSPSRRGPARPTMAVRAGQLLAAACGAAAVVTLALSGWYTATGATVVTQMITR